MREMERAIVERQSSRSHSMPSVANLEGLAEWHIGQAEKRIDLYDDLSGRNHHIRAASMIQRVANEFSRTGENDG